MVKTAVHVVVSRGRRRFLRTVVIRSADVLPKSAILGMDGNFGKATNKLGEGQMLTLLCIS